MPRRPRTPRLRATAAACTLLATALAALAALATLAAVAAPTVGAFTLCPHKVTRAVWAHGYAGWTLKVYPSVCGRITAAVDPQSVFDQAIDTATPPAGEPPRWDPNAASMYEQLRCHAWGAQIVDPTKPSWNLDTWRPLVAWSTEIRYGCNPPAGAR